MGVLLLLDHAGEDYIRAGERAACDRSIIEQPERVIHLEKSLKYFFQVFDFEDKVSTDKGSSTRYGAPFTYPRGMLSSVGQGIGVFLKERREKEGAG